MQLIEAVVKPFVKNRSVGIVDPLGGRRDVEDRPRGISLGARRGGLDGGLRPGQGFARGFSMRAKLPDQDGEQGQTTDSNQNVIVSGCAPGFKPAFWD